MRYWNCYRCGRQIPFDGKIKVIDGQVYHPNCPAKRPADLPEAGASAERISSVIRSARGLVSFGDWILASKIQLCDKRCQMKDIDTEFGNVKSNFCERESCPELVLKLLLDDVRSHF